METLKEQLIERENSCCQLKMEVVNLKRKIEKSNANDKFRSNSVILNEILENQRSSKDRSGLGFNKKGKEHEEYKLTSNVKCEMGSTSTESVRLCSTLCAILIYSLLYGIYMSRLWIFCL